MDCSVVEQDDEKEQVMESFESITVAHLKSVVGGQGQPPHRPQQGGPVTNGVAFYRCNPIKWA